MDCVYDVFSYSEIYFSLFQCTEQVTRNLICSTLKLFIKSTVLNIKDLSSNSAINT